MTKISKPTVLMIISFACLALSVVILGFALTLKNGGTPIGASSFDTTTAPDTTAKPETEQITPADTKAPAAPSDSTDAIPDHVYLGIVPVLQNPEMPNGCEVVSLVTVLNFLGFDVDKMEFNQKYVPHGEVGKVAPDQYYVGDPTIGKPGTGFGCLAPVITRAANAFFEDEGADYYAVNLTGTPLEELCEYVANGIPVIIWSTLEMKKSPITATWNIDGTKYTWLTYSHCTVLSGYTQNDYIFSDPTYDTCAYPKSSVEAAYHAQYMQAVAIFEK